MRRLVAALLIVCVLLISIPVPAHADAGDGVITRYDLTATVARDGRTQVRVDFDIDFGTDRQHGPYVTLPIRQQISGDPDHYRAFDISAVTARSSSGAPAEIQSDTNGGALVIKVGDPDREVTGRQSYQLVYTTNGLVNPKVSASGLDELNWNVIGTGWQIPLQNVSVTVIGPTPLARANCFAGDPDSRETCTNLTPDGDRTVFDQSVLEKGQGLTVVGGWPAGTFVGAEPRLIPRRNLGNLFTPEGGTIGGALVLALLGSAFFLRRARRQGRDEQYAGLTPGLAPTGTGAMAVQAATRTETAVRFLPPDDARPGPIGTLMDAKADPRDGTATVVDLAVRGWLRIEEISEDASESGKRDWQLIQLGQRSESTAGTLTGWEADLLEGLFSDDEPGAEILLSELKGSFATTMQSTQKALYRDVTDRGWFKADPSRVRNRAVLVGVGVFFLGVVATISLAVTLGWGLIGLAVVVVGIVALATAGRLVARTATGAAVLQQARGFELYLKTAEADQIRFEEGVDVFSRYLPYAIVFGVADRWTKVFTQLAEDGRYQADPTWYASGQMVGLNAFAHGGFDGLDAFSSVATSSMTASSPGSSGGSGFSGGGVGGGVGGGGGGSW